MPPGKITSAFPLPGIQLGRTPKVRLLKTNLWQQQEAVTGSPTTSFSRLPKLGQFFLSYGVSLHLRTCVYGSHQSYCTARTPRNPSAENPTNSRPSSPTKRGRKTHEIGVNHVVLALHNTDSFLPFWQAVSGKTTLSDGWCCLQSWQRYSKRDHTCFYRCK